MIGADGIRSTVARNVGAPLTRVGGHARRGRSTATGPTSTTDGYEWVFRPDACSGVIPTNDGQACVFAVARPARIGRGGVGVIDEIVAEGGA